MRREQYSPEIIAQASLEVASDPAIGNASLARRVEEVIAVGEDPFHLIFWALKDGRLVMERAEEIRRAQIANGKNGVK